MGEAESKVCGNGGPTVFKRILRGLRVLVVDDVADNTEIVNYLLTFHGAEVTVADSAATGMLAMESERFDVVVSDISMPEADGFEFLRMIRERETGTTKPMPVIALTALSGADDRAATAAAGFHAHLCKPVEPEKLVGMVAAVVGRC